MTGIPICRLIADEGDFEVIIINIRPVSGQIFTNKGPILCSVVEAAKS
uniref:Uncharacterized protein n=1 Tax=Rhodnius prolixus TaxID=13249 RepID=T1I031_RHOPR